MASLVASLAIVIVLKDQLGTSVRAASAVAVLCGLGAVGATISVRRGRFVNVGSVYALLLFLFHSGLLIFVALGLEIEFFNEEDQTWFASPALAPSATSIALGCLSFALGYVTWTSLRAYNSPALHELSARPSLSLAEEAVPIAGLMGLVAGVVAFYLQVGLSGVNLVGASYGAYLQGTRGLTLLPTVYLVIGLSFACVASARTPRIRLTGLLIFAIFAIPAMLIGLRGEVILPSAAWAIVAARRREIRPTLAHAAVLLGVLSVGSAVRVIRQGGASLSTIFDVALSPVAGVVETGYSIRPLIMVHRWHDAQHEPFHGFGSYLDPFDRLVRGQLLGLPVTDASVDERAFLPVLADRVGPIGGSSIAEAYYASGSLGVVLVLLMLGILAAILDGAHRGLMRDALVGMGAVVLLIWLRNDSTPIAGQLIILAAVLVAARLLAFVLQGQTAAARHRPRGVN
ncbi:O-antigen polysaccharide polymerase Wzy [Blastococcus sp. SYSU D01042]